MNSEILKEVDNEVEKTIIQTFDIRNTSLKKLIFLPMRLGGLGIPSLHETQQYSRDRDLYHLLQENHNQLHFQFSMYETKLVMTVFG